MPVFANDDVGPITATNYDGNGEVAENVAVVPVVQTTEDCEIVDDAVEPTGTTL